MHEIADCKPILPDTEMSKTSLLQIRDLINACLLEQSDGKVGSMTLVLFNGVEHAPTPAELGKLPIGCRYHG